jgi:hypothetical protein
VLVNLAMVVEQANEQVRPWHLHSSKGKSSPIIQDYTPSAPFMQLAQARLAENYNQLSDSDSSSCALCIRETLHASALVQPLLLPSPPSCRCCLLCTCLLDAP